MSYLKFDANLLMAISLAGHDQARFAVIAALEVPARDFLEAREPPVRDADLHPLGPASITGSATQAQLMALAESPDVRYVKLNEQLRFAQSA